MADRRIKTNVRSKGTARPKPIRPTPPPKLVVPFTSSDYNIPDEAVSSDEDESIAKPDKTRINESPPPLPPTPPLPEVESNEKQSGSKSNADFVEPDANVELESSSSSESDHKQSKHGKVVYRLSPSHYRPVGWGFIKISVVGLCFSALIGVIFALLSTKHSLDLKNETFKYSGENDYLRMRARKADDRGVNATTCVLNPPPISNCMVWDWDTESREKGTIVIYQCSNRMKSLAMIVICDYETTNWTVIKNVTNNCICDTDDT